MNSPDTIRDNLRQWLFQHRSLQTDDVLVEELCFLDKRNRADLVHANGSLTAYEIKSAADTLARWPDQMKAYLQVFDEVWLCFHGKHIADAWNTSPSPVGLLVVDDLGGMAVVRPARKNSHIDAFHLSGLLWRSEIDGLLQRLKLPTKRTERIKEARARLASNAPLATIQEKVLQCLKSRYPQYRVHSASVSPSSPLLSAGKAGTAGKPTLFK